MALDLNKIQAICFDVDGTLSDTDDQWVAGLERRLRPFRRLFPRGDSRAFARWAIMCAESPGNLVYSLLDRAGLDDEVGRLVSAISRRRSGGKGGNFLIIEGVRDALLLLRQRYPLAVVSARDGSGTQAFLRQYDLADLFPVVATAFTCAHTKPFPDPVIWAARQMGVTPDRCLMVGDTTVDIRAGRSAGAQTVGVLSGFGSEAELTRAGANLILPSASALAAVLMTSSGTVDTIKVE